MLFVKVLYMFSVVFLSFVQVQVSARPVEVWSGFTQLALFVLLITVHPKGKRISCLTLTLRRARKLLFLPAHAQRARRKRKRRPLTKASVSLGPLFLVALGSRDAEARVLALLLRGPPWRCLALTTAPKQMTEVNKIPFGRELRMGNSPASAL